MSHDPFWAQIKDQLARLSSPESPVRTFQGVRSVLLDWSAYPDVLKEVNRNFERSFDGSEAFFAGSGGGDSLADALHPSWDVQWLEGGYRWQAVNSATGDAFEYIEGDLEHRPALGRPVRDYDDRPASLGELRRRLLEDPQALVDAVVKNMAELGSPTRWDYEHLSAVAGPLDELAVRVGAPRPGEDDAVSDKNFWRGLPGSQLSPFCMKCYLKWDELTDEHQDEDHDDEEDDE